MQEIHSCLEVFLPNWNIRHLSAWSELIQPELMLEDATTHADVEAVEEATAQAQFQEVCSKIAQLI